MMAVDLVKPHTFVRSEWGAGDDGRPVRVLVCSCSTRFGLQDDGPLRRKPERMMFRHFRRAEAADRARADRARAAILANLRWARGAGFAASSLLREGLAFTSNVFPSAVLRRACDGCGAAAGVPCAWSCTGRPDGFPSFG